MSAILSWSLLLLGTPVVFANTQSAVSGSLNVVVTWQSITTAGGNTFYSGVFTEVLTGGQSGTAAGTITLVSHPDGTINTRAVGTFSGTVLGSTEGTAALSAQGQGTFVSFSGNYVLNQGTGGLQGLHVEGSFVASGVTGTGTYSGQAQFS